MRGGGAFLDKIGGDFTVDGQITFLDCKSFSSEKQVEKKGEIFINTWVGYGYDLTRALNTLGARAGVSLIMKLNNPAIVQIGDEFQLKLHGRIFKAGADWYIRKEPTERTIFNLHRRASVQVYPGIKFEISRD